MIEISENSEDFYFIEEDSSFKVTQNIVELVSKTIPNKYGLNPLTDIQVICPQKKSEVGTIKLNTELQKVLNPKAYNKEELIGVDGILREGDRVMHIANNYNIGVFNGEVGVIDEINKKGWKDELTGHVTHMDVQFPDRSVSYSKNEIDQLRLCYACTCHKFQGSQQHCIVMPVHSTNTFMLWRPLLYTAVTRAEKLCFLVGNMKGLKHAIRNNKVVKRNTSLERRLRGLKMKDMAKDLEEDQLSW